MTNTEVLLVVPTLGTRSTLVNALRSVRDYGGNALAVVMVGPEASRSPCLGMAQEAGLEVEFVAERGRGQAAAILQGWESSTAEWYTWLNDDDQMLPGFRFLLSKAQSCPEAPIVCGDLLIRSGTGEVRVRHASKVSRWTLSGGRCYVPGVLPLISRRALMQVDLTGARDIAFDYEWFVRLLELGPARSFNVLVGVWVEHDDARTVANAADARKASLQIGRQYFPVMRPRWLWRYVAAIAIAAGRVSRGRV